MRLDSETVAAMTFERRRQHNVPLTRAFTDLVAELSRHGTVDDGRRRMRGEDPARQRDAGTTQLSVKP